MSTDVTSPPPSETKGADAWSSFFGRLLPVAAIAGPALMLLGALCVAFGIQTLPGDLDWISEPEGMFGMFAVPFLFATWIVAGRTIARRASRTGIAVTMIGTVAAAGWAFPFTIRLFSADLVLNDYDANAINEVWEGDTTVYSLVVFVFMTVMNFVVAITAGIAILRTRVAPIWAGIALIAFVPVFITAQAAYVAIEVTYPLAITLLLVGVVGVVRADRAATSQ